MSLVKEAAVHAHATQLYNRVLGVSRKRDSEILDIKIPTRNRTRLVGSNDSNRSKRC